MLRAGRLAGIPWGALCWTHQLASGQEHSAVTDALISLWPEQAGVVELEVIWCGH